MIKFWEVEAPYTLHSGDFGELFESTSQYFIYQTNRNFLRRCIERFQVNSLAYCRSILSYLE